MANLTRGLDELYPDWNWYEDSLDTFVDEASLKGIIIGVDRPSNARGYRNQHAVSFSGFSSQGDGLCFDCDIKWPEFIEAHPDFKEKLPEWFLLLSANPDYVEAGMNRSQRGNTMTALLEFDYPDVVESGFFAGLDMTDEVPDLSDADLETYVKNTCTDLASDWYHRLDKEYDFICDDMRQQRVNELIEEHCTDLRTILAALPAKFDQTIIHYEYAEYDFEDLNNLGLVEHVTCGAYRVSDAGKGLL